MSYELKELIVLSFIFGMGGVVSSLALIKDMIKYKGARIGFTLLDISVLSILVAGYLYNLTAFSHSEFMMVICAFSGRLLIDLLAFPIGRKEEATG